MIFKFLHQKYILVFKNFSPKYILLFFCHKYNNFAPKKYELLIYKYPTGTRPITRSRRDGKGHYPNPSRPEVVIPDPARYPTFCYPLLAYLVVHRILFIVKKYTFHIWVIWAMIFQLALHTNS